MELSVSSDTGEAAKRDGDEGKTQFDAALETDFSLFMLLEI